jgi:hypothetical protein
MEKNEKMKKFTLIGIVLSLFVGIVYTGVLNYYGKIVGTINVQAPIFYASNDCQGNSCKLYVNELPSQYSGQINNISLAYFDTEKLGVNKWYNSVWKITLKIQPSSQSQKIDYTLKFTDASDKVICAGSITLSSLETITISCPLNETELTPSHYLELILSSKNSFDIYVDGTTKIEVSKV